MPDERSECEQRADRERVRIGLGDVGEGQVGLRGSAVLRLVERAPVECKGLGAIETSRVLVPFEVVVAADPSS